MNTSAKTYKIVYCTPALYSAGGTERVVCVKANYMADVLGHDVTIIVTEGHNKDSFFPLSPKVHVVNLAIGFEDLWEKNFMVKVLLYIHKQWHYRQKLKAVLMQLQPDFTISTLRREINFLTTIADGSIKIGELHLSRRNFRSQDHGGLLRRLFHRWWRWDLLSKLRRLDKFVALTEKAASEWPELDNITIIPDPLPLALTDHVSHFTPKRVIVVGRYAYEKGYDLMLQAWALIERKFPDWRLDMYGMGNREPYNLLSEQLGIDATRCKLHGSLTDVKSVYQESELLVLPSRTEGFGLVLLEAMACGLPVIAFDCENGPGSIITDGVSGLLVKPYDVELLAGKMAELMGDEERRQQMGSQGRSAAAQYAIGKVAQQWQQLFDQLKSATP